VRTLAAVSVSEALDGAATAIAAAGSPTPRLDAELLLAAALGVPRERLHSDPEMPVAGPAVRAFQTFVGRRSGAREPVAYITGRRAFRGLELAVDRRVLIPRPETELLVEVVLALPSEARVLEVGTGSGAVALALACERPDLQLVASELSADALAVARANGARLGLAVDWRQADLLEGLAGPFDAILANLPYVASAELRQLGPEIWGHEPHVALDGGPDGLAVIRRLVGAAGAVVPWLALEVGAGQAQTVAAMLREAGFGQVAAHRDLAGIERVLAAEQ
jgi:release factor glutamine methyltransferase